MNDVPARVRTGQRVGRFRAVHAIHGRIRFKSRLMSDPAFDRIYFQALIEAVEGVEAARVNVRGGSLTVFYDGSELTWRRIAARLESIPLDAYLDRPGGDDAVEPAQVAAMGCATILAQALPRPLKAGVIWGLSFGTVLKGVETLFTRGVKVETLDASAIVLALSRERYFTAGAIATLLALGQCLEGKSERRSSDLIKSLLRPQAERIWVVRDGVEVCIPVEEAVIGDLAVLGAGELVPIDGVTVEGEASVNQSSISGESAPAHIKPGDPVISGSVVEEGRLIVRMERVGSETSMARISRYIDQSLRAESRTQTKSSELADKLVPVTLGLSGLMFLVSRDVNRAASVLTVDFSCAVKLASPVAVRSCMYAAGQAGALLKGAAALDALQDVDCLVFDKTGTLTTGELAVTDVLPCNGLDEDALLRLAAGAEEHYDHPVARAVVREAKNRYLTLPAISRVDFIVAHGVSASISGENVLVGSHHFVAEDEGVDCSALEEAACALRMQGKSLLYVSKAGALSGLVALRDDPRPEAGETLDDLKKRGIKRVVVLTGDHKQTALALTGRLPQIDAIHYELRPEDKALIVEELKSQGYRPAYVGDGVNDAPALVAAHVGICMPRGADLAREAAQALLLKEDLRALAAAFEAAKRAGKVIRRSFAATIGLNSLTMLLAAGGLSPVAAALMHNASTVGILGYAALAASRPLKEGATGGAAISVPAKESVC